jgi:hypothetical protein
MQELSKFEYWPFREFMSSGNSARGKDQQHLAALLREFAAQMK